MKKGQVTLPEGRRGRTPGAAAPAPAPLTKRGGGGAVGYH